MVHVLQPCVRAVNRNLPLVTGPQQSGGAAARALSDQDAACGTAWRRLGPQPGPASGAIGDAWFGASEALYQASQSGYWYDDVPFYVGNYGEGIHDFVLSAAPVLDVSPGCVAAALGWSAADARQTEWPIAGAGCPRLPAILR